MDKNWILAIGTVLFIYNYDLVNGLYYRIPKVYKGKKVQVLSSRDLPPSIVVASIRRDDGTIEYLDKTIVYPELDFETDRDRHGRITTPTNWASAYKWSVRAARNMDNVIDLLGSDFVIKRLHDGILMALKPIVEEVLSDLWGGGRKKEIIRKIREDPYGRKILYLLPPKISIPLTTRRPSIQDGSNEKSTLIR